MLGVLKPFRNKLDELMLPCKNKSIVLYGYGYSGQFIRWYAKYYHDITIDYIIWEDMPTRGIPFNNGLFTPEVLDYGFRSIPDSVIWLTVPLIEPLKSNLSDKGFDKDINIIDFIGEIYGNDLFWPKLSEKENDPHNKRKTGKRDIQFLEWLEWKYGCNFVTALSVDELVGEESIIANASPYCVTTQKEIFEILEKAFIQHPKDMAIIDMGCGKGGAIISFLDYGFKNVGGIEFDPLLFETLQENINRLGLRKTYNICCINEDAGKVTDELDRFNIFYFFDPFKEEIYMRCIKNIFESVKHNPREVRLIVIYPVFHEQIERMGFVLENQFTVDMRKKVVNIYRM